MIARAGLAGLGALCAGCLGPQVSDELGAGAADILPAGATVPSADDDPAENAVIAAHDQVDGVVPRTSAFAAGAAAHTWDFGPTPEFAAPVFELVRATAPGTFELVDHLPILEFLPDDPGYSPYGSIFYVEITPAYQGQLLTSTYALQEAAIEGLVLGPRAQLKGVDRPVVASDVRLEVGGGQPPLAPAGRAYYDGNVVRYFDFGEIALADAAHLPESAHYVLRRDGSEPLSEPIRHVDLDGDGDLEDTNDIFAAAPTAPGYAPRCRTITVAVPTATASIDTSHDEAVADLRDASQLFDPDPVAGTVVAFDTTDDVRNCPLQRQAGSL